MASAPLINGRRFSYSSIEIIAKIGATAQELFIDVDDIAYDESLVIAFKNGTARVPLGVTAGVWESQEGQLVMGKSTFQDMVNQVGPGWLGINMLINLSYFDVGESLVVDTINAMIVGVGEAHTYGPDPLKSTLRFNPLSPIARNGIPSVLNVARVV